MPHNESVDRPVTPSQALAELLLGNERFVAGATIHPNQDADYRASLAAAQTPFAVIFGCSDSRLAAEIIFDRGLGDVFVVRTAGHTLGDSVLGSIEYAVTVLRTPLVAVLGHNSCGAVRAARDAVVTGVHPTGHVRAIVEPVTPSVRALGVPDELINDTDDVDRIVDIHIQRTVRMLHHESPVLDEAVRAGQCDVVGLSYRLDDGKVRLLDSGPAPHAPGRP
jgi:carbonic anhydrase